MIRKLIFFMICAAVVIRLGGCSPKIDADKALEAFDSTLEFIGRGELTQDFLLSGERIFGGERYFGEYAAELKNKTGVETLFGGTSIYLREAEIAAHISADSGSAKVTVTVSGRSYDCEPDENGDISLRVELNGSSYISVSYEGFTGWVSVKSENAE